MAVAPRQPPGGPEPRRGPIMPRQVPAKPKPVMQQPLPPPPPPPPPQADPAEQRRLEIEALRQQHGGCIWRVWVRVENSGRIIFTPVYLQVDAEDLNDGTTVIRHASRSWVFQTAAIDSEVLGLERAIEERWISADDYRAFLF